MSIDEILNREDFTRKILETVDISLFNDRIQKYFDKYNDKNYYYILDYIVCKKLSELTGLDYYIYKGQYAFITDFSEHLSLRELFNLEFDKDYKSYDIDVFTKESLEELFSGMNDILIYSNLNQFIQNDFHSMVLYSFLSELEKDK